MTARRQRRSMDPIIAGDVRAAERICHAAVVPLDRLEREMEQKWGIGKLEGWMTPEVAMMVAERRQAVYDALDASDTTAIRPAVERMLATLKRMDEIATEQGRAHSPALGEYTHNGKRYMFVEDTADWVPIKNANPDAFILSLRECAIAYEAKAGHPMIENVKTLFPGAEVSAIRPKGPVPDDDLEGLF